MHQRCFAPGVGLVHAGAVRDEKLHHRQVAAPGRDHQAGADAVGEGVGVQAAIQPGARQGEVPGFDAGAESRRIGRRGARLRVRGATHHEQRDQAADTVAGK